MARHPLQKLSVEVSDNIVRGSEDGSMIKIAFWMYAYTQILVDTVSESLEGIATDNMLRRPIYHVVVAGGLADRE